MIAKRVLKNTGFLMAAQIANRIYGRHMFDALSLEDLLGSAVMTVLVALDPFQTFVKIIQSVPEKQPL